MNFKYFVDVNCVIHYLSPQGYCSLTGSWTKYKIVQKDGWKEIWILGEDEGDGSRPVDEEYVLHDSLTALAKVIEPELNGG